MRFQKAVPDPATVAKNNNAKGAKRQAFTMEEGDTGTEISVQSFYSDEGTIRSATKHDPTARRTDYPDLPAELAGYSMRRFDLVIPINSKIDDLGNYNWLADVRNGLVKAVNSIKAVHKDAVILRYRNNDKNLSKKCLSESSEVPRTLIAMKEYFPSIFAGPDMGSKMTCQLLLGVKNLSAFHELVETLSPSAQTDVAFYNRPIQTEKVVSVGWLLYSFKTVNRPTLQKQIQKRIDNKIGFSEQGAGGQIHLAWRSIRRSVPKQNGVDAIHIVTALQDVEKIVPALVEIYDAKTPVIALPMCARFQFIPSPPKTMKPRNEIKWLNLVKHQELVQEEMERNHVSVYGMNNVDTPLGEGADDKTFRELLMGMRSERDPSRPIFWYVDQVEEHHIRLYYASKYESEAKTSAASLYDATARQYGAELADYIYGRHNATGTLRENKTAMQKILECSDIGTVIQFCTTNQTFQAMLIPELRRRKQLFKGIAEEMIELLDEDKLSTAKVLSAKDKYGQLKRLVGFEDTEWCITHDKSNMIMEEVTKLLDNDHLPTTKVLNAKFKETEWCIDHERSTMIMEEGDRSFPEVFMLPPRFYAPPASVGEVLPRSHPLVREFFRQIDDSVDALMATSSQLSYPTARYQVLLMLIKGTRKSNQLNIMVRTELLRIFRRELCVMDPRFMEAYSEQICIEDEVVYGLSLA